MSIKPCSSTSRGWTLVEMMMALGISALCGLVLMGMYLFCVRGMAEMYNYALLDQNNRQAMDRMTSEIRQSKQVLACTTNSITLLTANSDGSTGPQVTYQFNPTGQQLLRTTSDGASQMLLNNCSLILFKLYTRIPTNRAYDCYPVASGNWSNTVKVLQLTWKTSITNLPSPVISSENIQTAFVVIRKQQDN
jgi:Tfp pilus assembly protein PilW